MTRLGRKLTRAAATTALAAAFGFGAIARAEEPAPPTPAVEQNTAAPTPAEPAAAPAPTPSQTPAAESAGETKPAEKPVEPAVEKPAETVAQPEKASDEYRPLLTFERWGWRLQVPVMLAGRVEGASSIPVDAQGGEFQSGVAISPMLRVGVRIETVVPLAKKFLIFAEYEHDLPTGTWTSDSPIAGVGLPNSQPITTQLRKGWGRLSIGPYLHIGGGFMTNNWGLGLVANDGAHGWTPGSARFTDPRGGDIVLRGFLATGPLTRANILAEVAFDKVWHDDVLLTGDAAYQIIATALVGHNKPNQGGFFLVHRRQTTADGSTLNVTVIDLAGKVGVQLSKAKLSLEAEAALVTGQTTLGASPEVMKSDVLQLGAVLRASLAWQRAGGVLDVVYASGDQNTHDPKVNDFHADPNFQEGLFLFRYVQAAQTGRGAGLASDPQLVGYPPSGADRIPSRGGLTNTVVVFPRVWVRPAKGLETYGGVLVALAPVKNMDPFNTDVSGGAIKNALGGNPGNYWGTEIDVGLRYNVLLRKTELGLGLEGGVLVPGSALVDAMGTNPRPMYGGRFMLSYRL